MEKRKTAFIPGSFRPFGNHHMQMVRHYSDMCDDVVVVVSNPQSGDSARKTSAGTEISAEDAKEIIDICLADEGIENVKCIVSRDSNPFKTIFREISKLNDCEVVLGVGQKGSDPDRYSNVKLDMFKDHGVEILPPSETAFPEVSDDGVAVSATDARNHIDDRNVLRTYLPVSVGDDEFERIYGILNGNRKADERERYDSSVFESLLDEDVPEEEPAEQSAEGPVEKSAELDEEETEFSGIQLDDGALEDAECSIIAYNTHVSEAEAEAYTPKNNPDKAVDVVFGFGDGNEVEIYLDTESGEWDSRVNGVQKLTPDQMGQFLQSDFCRRMCMRLHEMWPGSDPFFEKLLEAVDRKKISLEPCETVSEDGEFRKGNIDKSRSREKNAAGEQIYTNSGRKIVSFSDFGVKHTEDEAYYVWPEKNKEFKWSQWADWTKLKVCCRCRFQHNSYLYGLSLSFFAEDDKNRGFRSYNLDLEPKLQYCTPTETQEMLDLTLVKKFLRNALKRLNRFTSMPDEEIFRKINRPDKCTLDDIRTTKHIVKNTMKAIRDRRADTFIYT